MLDDQMKLWRASLASPSAAPSSPPRAAPAAAPVSGPASAAIAVRRCESAEEFAALAPEWNRVHAQAAAASVFNSWMCLFEWWMVYGAGRALRILLAAENDNVVGILPLYVESTSVLGKRVRLLRLVGSGGDTHPDDLGPVLAAGREEAVAGALAEAALRLPGWDVLHAPDIDPRSRFPKALAEAACAAGLRCDSGRSERIAYVELPGTWEAFLAAQSASRRQRLRSIRRKLGAAHATRFFVWDDAAGLEGALQRLVALHRARWQATGESESFSTSEYVEFHRRVITGAFARGWLRLYCLEIDGALAAMTYCYRFRNRVYLMQAGFDPAHARWHPGAVLLGHALEHAIGEGNEVFDFLRGEHRYKNELASGYRDTVYVRAWRPSLGAALHRAHTLHAPAWKARARGWLKGLRK